MCYSCSDSAHRPADCLAQAVPGRLTPHARRAGPTVAEAVFLNHEELSVRVVYRDPVHDFAFVCCDLAALKVRSRGGTGGRSAMPAYTLCCTGNREVWVGCDPASRDQRAV